MARNVRNSLSAPPHAPRSTRFVRVLFYLCLVNTGAFACGTLFDDKGVCAGGACVSASDSGVSDAASRDASLGDGSGGSGSESSAGAGSDNTGGQSAPDDGTGGDAGSQGDAGTGGAAGSPGGEQNAGAGPTPDAGGACTDPGEACAAGAGGLDAGAPPCTPGTAGCALHCAVWFEGEPDVGCGGNTPYCLNAERLQTLPSPDAGADITDGGTTTGTSSDSDASVGADATDEGRCVECLTDKDCGNGLCEDFACVTCAAGAATATAEGSPLAPGVVDPGCAAAAPFCVGAAAEARTCVECLANPNCSDPTRPLCVDQACSPCGSHGDCANLPGGSEAPLCNSATGECQQCLTHSDCPSAERAQCDPDTHQCVPCTSNAHCTEAGARVCQLESARCVECTATQSDGCAGKVCDTRPGASQFTCSQRDPGSSNKCEDCVSDAQCLQGQKCVPTSFQGVSTGHQCFWLEGSPGAPALCDAIVAPYVERTSTTSLDGTSGVYCQLATTTCDAYFQWREVGCSSDDECGLPGVSDGLCRAWNGAPACTYPCVSDADCTFTCDTMVGECLLE